MGMSAHEYLCQYLALQRDIERWKRVFKELAGDEYEDWIVSNGAKLAASYSGMPRSNQGIDYVASAGSVMAQKDYDRERYARESIQKARAAQLQISQAIDAVPLNLARQVLDLRYLQGKSIDEIAAEIDRSSVTTRKACNKALAMVEVPEEVTQKDHE